MGVRASLGVPSRLECLFFNVLPVRFLSLREKNVSPDTWAVGAANQRTDRPALVVLTEFLVIVLIDIVIGLIMLII